MTAAVLYNVLIVDSQSHGVRPLLEALAARGLRATVKPDAAGLAKAIDYDGWDLVMVSLADDATETERLISELRRVAPELPVVPYGGASEPGALLALRLGCRDYLPWPCHRDAIETMLESVLPNHAVPLVEATEGSHHLLQMAGRSPRFLDTLRLAAKVAPTTIPVLITGESGTGKELISYYLHRQSRRASGPYVRVNCAALSESLLESELFGHERGAFTGAHAQRKGRFERADGGTLLLDEISETGPRLQAELLRVLEQQDFERVGGSGTIRVNVRVICTSNRDLAAEVEAGRFRRDLYYRIAGVHLRVPPLRHRRQDIPVLVWHFVNHYAREVKRRITTLDDEMLATFDRYGWPGNVRELRNVVRQSLVLGDGPTLSIRDLPISLGATAKASPAGTLQLQELEKQAIFEALRQTDRHQAKAARLLGITDRTLREKLRRYRLDEETNQDTGEMQWALSR
jgi:DNA-binding NtrC family response regulator